MPTVREALLRLRWAPDNQHTWATVRVFYRHRGAPQDEASFEGADIEHLGPSFVTVRHAPQATMIPYHRILRVDVGSRVVWQRAGPQTLGELEARGAR